MMEIPKALKAMLSWIMYLMLWWWLVISAAQQDTGAAEWVIFSYLTFHILILVNTNHLRFAKMLVGVFLYGLFIETLFQTFSVLEFLSKNQLVPIFAPFWVAWLYPLFASSCSLSPTYLKDKVLLSACLGFFFSMLAYSAAVYIGAARFPFSNLYSMLTIGFAWAMNFRLILIFATACDWYKPNR